MGSKGGLTSSEEGHQLSNVGTEFFVSTLTVGIHLHLKSVALLQVEIIIINVKNCSLYTC